MIEELTGMALQRQILPEVFSCPLYAACYSSTHGMMDGGDSCSMSFVGPDYETMRAKVACIGIDHRDNVSSNYLERTNGILNHYQANGCKFNPHYQGVVRTAAAFLGGFGEQCNACWPGPARCCRMATDPTVQDCVLDRIVQPNSVKCVPLPLPGQENANSRSTPTMRANCSNHLLAELRIMKPRLAVFHGADLKWPFLNALSGAGMDRVELPIGLPQPLTAIEVPALDMLMFFFHHPARNKLAQQWPTVVEPCLEYLRHTGEIA